MATAYERVRIARGAKRPTGIDYLQNVFHGFFELHGDRRYADDPAIVGGLAYLGATPVTVIAIEKGHTAKERVQRGFGAPQPEGYRKALRLMREVDALTEMPIQELLSARYARFRRFGGEAQR